MKNRPRTSQSGRIIGFTLIELLVGIAIIAILAAMILPALASASFTANGWGIGYQYYGGVKTWVNNVRASSLSASPIKTSLSKPSWMLAADMVFRFELGSGWTWGDGLTDPPGPGFANLPAHKRRGGLPAGGNEVFIDGSARWVKSTEMYYIHTWTVANRELYFYQDDLGELDALDLRKNLKKIP